MFVVVHSRSHIQIENLEQNTGKISHNADKTVQCEMTAQHDFKKYHRYPVLYSTSSL